MEWEILSTDKRTCRFPTALRKIGALFLTVTEDDRTQRREVNLFAEEKKGLGSTVCRFSCNLP